MENAGTNMFFAFKLTEELNKALFFLIKYFGNGIKPHPGVLRLYYNGSPGLPFHSPHPSGQGRGKPQGP